MSPITKSIHFCAVIEWEEDNSVSLLELSPPNPWDSDPKIPVDLEVGELQVSLLFFSHQ